MSTQFFRQRGLVPFNIGYVTESDDLFLARIFSGLGHSTFAASPQGVSERQWRAYSYKDNTLEEQSYASSLVGSLDAIVIGKDVKRSKSLHADLQTYNANKFYVPMLIKDVGNVPSKWVDVVQKTLRKDSTKYSF